MATKETTTKAEPWTCLIIGAGNKEWASDKCDWIWRLSKQMLHKEWTLSSRTMTKQ